MPLLVLSLGCSMKGGIEDIFSSDAPSGSQKVDLKVTPLEMVLTEGMDSSVEVTLSASREKSLSLMVTLTSTIGTNRFMHIPGIIVIPAGQTSITIPIRTFDDVFVQPVQTWTLSVVSQDLSLDAAPQKVTITLYDNDGGTTPGFGTTLGGPMMLREFNKTPAVINKIKMTDGRIIFSSEDPANGRELWVTDGTVAGTGLIKDIYPGVFSSDPTAFTLNPIINIVYFTAITPTSGSELWRTDGTTAGTFQLADVTPGVTSTTVGVMGQSGGLTYFSMGGQVWVSNGTPAGTQALAASMDWGSLGYGVDWNGTFFFGASDSNSGAGIWKSDGTNAGTVQASAIETFISGAPQDLFVWNNKLYYHAYSYAAGREPYVTDGTIAGTSLLKDIGPGSSNSGTGAAVASLGSRLLLHGYNSASGNVYQQIFTTDGTAAGTTNISGVANIGELWGDLTGKVVYVSEDSANKELWVTDGTSPGTFMLKDICSGTGSSLSTGGTGNRIQLGSLVIFVADDCVNGKELWVTDGTAVGTLMLKDINPGSASSLPAELIVVGSKVVFSAFSASGREVWVTDGTPGGTTQFVDIAPGSASSSPNNLIASDATHFFFTAYNPSIAFATMYWGDLAVGTVKSFDQVLIPTGNAQMTSIVAFGSNVFFSATDNGPGNNLWMTDGTDAGTSKVIDIFPSMNCSDISSIIVVGANMYFSTSADAVGNELWKSDGTAAGTSMVKDIESGLTSSSPQTLTKFGSSGKFIFNASTTTYGIEPWISDGTSAGTTLLKDIVGGATGTAGSYTYNASQNLIWGNLFNGSSAYMPVVSNGTTAGTFILDLSGYTGTFITIAQTGAKTHLAVQSRLFLSNGTQAGTTQITPAGATIDMAAGYATGAPLGANGYIFVAQTAAEGKELWYSDGTGATSLVKDITPGAAHSEITQISVIGSKIIFNVNSSDLWISDGTSAGTFLLASGVQKAGYGTTTFGGKYYFAATTAAAGSELWVTDGTALGTEMVKDINPGTSGSALSTPVVFNTKLYFSADDGVHGAELWSTDGTTTGTQLVSDINPGLLPSNPISIQVLNGKLYLLATKILTGQEIWVMAP
jgi:ELWxxDGT repeat protein